MQCSDWGARPLNASQIAYAAVDVLVLTRIFDSLCFCTELAARNSAHAVGSICRRYTISAPAMPAGSTFDGYGDAPSSIPFPVDQYLSLKATLMKELQMPKGWAVPIEAAEDKTT